MGLNTCIVAYDDILLDFNKGTYETAVAWDAEKLEISGAQFLPDFVPIYLGFKCL